MQKYFSDVQVAARYGIHRKTTWKWAKRGILPPPVKISRSCTRWIGEQLDEFDAKREQAA